MDVVSFVSKSVANLAVGNAQGVRVKEGTHVGVISHLISFSSGKPPEAVIRHALGDERSLGHFVLDKDAVVRSGLPVEIVHAENGRLLKDMTSGAVIGLGKPEPAS